MLSLWNLPRQQLSFKKKDSQWRRSHLDWADRKIFYTENPVRKSFVHKRINYNLVNGRLDMNDLMVILNPGNIKASFVPDRIQHYPIINSKLNVLRGEEYKRRFDYRIIVTNPDSISTIQENKKAQLFSSVQELLRDTSISEEEFADKLDKIGYFFDYEWKDTIEILSSYVLKHYSKEYNFPLMFNSGFMDAMIVGEEIYQCDIVGGEPIMKKVDPLKIQVFRNGYSNKVEDADIIVLIDYWSPGRIIDTFYDQLTEKDIKYLDEISANRGLDGDTIDYDERDTFISSLDIEAGDSAGEGTIIDGYAFLAGAGHPASTTYIDSSGNVRVLRVYWRSKRKVLRVKSYDLDTGEETYDFYPETYIVNKALGEEAKTLWINEMWEGTKIGKDIYINMRPRIIQYNRLDNPSRCHAGIVGSFYTLNGYKPYSLVDVMKPFSYAYDVIHNRLRTAIANNWGKMSVLDLSKVPDKWTVEKWLYYAKTMGLAVVDSFKEANSGRAKGVLAGNMQPSQNVIDADTGNYIQQHINLLEWIKSEMSEAAGVSRQREGQISNRETVGGVERATLQSSHITEWLFAIHDDVKRRALECFLETAKIAMKGKTKKFQYIESDEILKTVEIDGNEFANSDYGIVVDNGQDAQRLAENLTMLAQAALQNQRISFSSIMKIYSSPSLSEIRRIIERDERNIQEREAQAQQQQLEAQQQMVQQQTAVETMKLELEDLLNQRDNDTKLLIAQLKDGGIDADELDDVTADKRAELAERAREFDLNLKETIEARKANEALKKEELRAKREALNRSMNKSKNK